MRSLVLASTSRYRRELLERLGVPFTAQSPGVDETAQPGEAPLDIVRRLSEEKARAVGSGQPDAWVIGSDQLAEFDGQALGKPGHREAAVAQLKGMSGRSVVFHTAVCVFGPGARRVHLDRTVVRFRALSDDEVERYVDIEKPFDCAGSFKSEGLGITLFDAIETHDPTALIGLPLIATARLLREAGFSLP